MYFIPSFISSTSSWFVKESVERICPLLQKKVYILFSLSCYRLGMSCYLWYILFHESKSRMKCNVCNVTSERTNIRCPFILLYLFCGGLGRQHTKGAAGSRYLSIYEPTEPSQPVMSDNVNDEDRPQHRELRPLSECHTPLGTIMKCFGRTPFWLTTSRSLAGFKLCLLSCKLLF